MKKNMTINSTKFIKFIKNFILSEKSVVPFVHGKAGIGKTEIISVITKELGYKLVILNLNHQEEGDLIGIPREENGIMVYSKPEWIGLHEKNEKVLIFLDEIDRAQKNILNVSLTLIREYRIHTHQLPKTWKMIAAGNSGINDDFYDTNELDFALKSRFIHLFYELNTKEWIDWASKNNINENIIEYLKLYNKHLIYEPESNDIFAYPNPRTWHILSDSLSFTPDERLGNVIIGTIGEEVGTSFYTFMKTQKNEDFPIPFTEFLEDLTKTIKKYDKKSKNGVFNTNSTFLNNFKHIVKQTNHNKLIEIMSRIICSCIKRDYYELVAVIFNTIKGMSKDGEKFNIAIITYIENSKDLNIIYEKYKKVINN